MVVICYFSRPSSWFKPGNGRSAHGQEREKKVGPRVPLSAPMKKFISASVRHAEAVMDQITVIQLINGYGLG